MSRKDKEEEETDDTFLLDDYDSSGESSRWTQASFSRADREVAQAMHGV